PLLSFVILSYVIFIVFLMVTGLAMFVGAPNAMVNFLKIVVAWSSDFAIVILFKRIYPGLRLKYFIKMQFSPKLRFSVIETMIMGFIKKQFYLMLRFSGLVTVIKIQVIITAVVILLLSTTSDPPGVALSFTGFGLFLIAFLDNLVRGPLGEQLGWRGVARKEV